MKLKEPVTRDLLNAWDLSNRAYFRQHGYGEFLPGGTGSTWPATEDDETHGIPVQNGADSNPDNAGTNAA